MSQHRGQTQQHPQRDVRRVRAQIPQVQRRAQPDEEQRTEKALGEREQLPGQPAGLADTGHRHPEREPCQHDRYVRLSGQRGEPEQDREADPQLDRVPTCLRDAVHPSAQAAAFQVPQPGEDHD